MNPKAPPWFPFYFADYLADTLHLSHEQHAVYLFLIIACWDRYGRLPDNDAALAVIARLPLERWLEHRRIIAKFFSVDVNAGEWTHKRVTAELAKATAFIEAGRRGAVKRWGNRTKLTVVGAIALLVAPPISPAVGPH